LKYLLDSGKEKAIFTDQTVCKMDTKSHIQKESLKLFLKKSFKDVTLNEILEKTGLSKGGFYYYYESKEQLFLEIIEAYFSYMVVYNFEKYSRNSLKEFYEDHIKDLGRAVKKFTSEKAKIGGNNAMNTNYLYPIFDAMRILPEFGGKMREARRKEIDEWSGAVGRARLAGEIKSVMSDDHIARIFIYTGNSIGLQLIMEDAPVNSMTGLFLDFWNKFYESLKA
jgi:TetR/AcrR family transcriptional regulator, transcriptional repressor for nem operon